MRFRLYQSSDRETCLALLRSNQPLYFNQDDQRDFEEWLDHGQTETYWLLIHHEKPVGCGGIFINHERAEAGLAWGMIHQAHHQQGYGAALTTFRLGEISKRVSYPVKLCTSQHTYRFYERLGFKVVKVTPNGFDQDLDRYDMTLSR